MILSVIVPAYNMAPFVNECLLSVLAQKTDFPFEVIVCDDCSKDRTREIIRSLKPRFDNLSVIENEVNVGLVEVMRRMLQAAKGKYIAYMDADDVALPGKLQMQVDYMEQNLGCTICYHESEVFDTLTGGFIKYYSRDFYNSSLVPKIASIEHLVKYTVFLQASSVMVRNYPGIAGSVDHGNKIICDYPWHIMNSGKLKGTIDFIDEVLGRYRIHGASFGAATQGSPERRIKVAEELASACTLADQFGVEKEIVDFGIDHIYFSAALYFLKRTDYANFRLMIDKSVTAGVRFDERHKFAVENRDNPDIVKRELGL